jgi:membrane protease YdiL (CAAX protease family)
VEEGETGGDIYFLIQGEVEILKKDPETNQLHKVAILGAGQTIGEMALVDQSPRSATVKATTDLEVLVISFFKFTENQALYSKLVTNISKELSNKLRKTDETTVRSLKAELEGEKVRVEMGNFLFAMFTILSTWILFINFADQIYHLVHPVIFSSTMVLVLMIAAVNHVRTSIYKMSFYGLNLNGWKQGIFESIIFTTPFLALSVLGKLWLITNVPKFQSLPLFNLKYLQFGWTPEFKGLIVYTLFVPIQEFIARGVIQSSIKASLPGKTKSIWSIFLASLIFSSFHAHISIGFAIGSLFAGFIWGWLYNRQHSLVSPTLSHALFGFWSLSVLDLAAVVRAL